MTEMDDERELMEKVLAAPLADGNDAGAADVRGYLYELLRTLWKEDSHFSGKRPFGNSGWQHEVYDALAEAGLLESAEKDEDDDWDLDPREADNLIYRALIHLMLRKP